MRGQVTLDECGYHFTSEANRVARRQVMVMSGKQQVGVSNEVVAYDTAAHAAQALDQLRSAVTTCSQTEPVPTGVAGTPPMRHHLMDYRSRAPGFPVTDNALAVEQVTLSTGESGCVILAFQREGRILSGIYMWSMTAPTPQQVIQAGQLAGITGKRLAMAATDV